MNQMKKLEGLDAKERIAYYIGKTDCLLAVNGLHPAQDSVYCTFMIPKNTQELAAHLMVSEVSKSYFQAYILGFDETLEAQRIQE